MKMSRTEPYIHHGLIVTAMTAWALLLVIDVISIIITGFSMPILGLVFVYLTWGLVSAYLFTVILGYPIWKIARRYKLDTSRNAVITGAFAGLLAGSINFYTLMYGKLSALNFLDLGLTISVGGFAAWVGHKKAYEYVSEQSIP